MLSLFNNIWDTYNQIKSLSEFCPGIGLLDHSHKSNPTNDCEPIAKLLRETKQLSVEEIKKLKKYCFPFENIVLSGGAANGVSYVGAYKALYELNIIPQIKNVAGCSAGSLGALFY